MVVARQLNFWLGIGAAIAAAAMAAFGYTEATRTVQGVVAATPIPQNTPIVAADLRTASVPAGFAQSSGIVTDPQALLGHFLSVPAAPGEAITGGMVASNSDLQAVLTQFSGRHHLPGVLVQIAGTSALIGLVQGGDTIGLITSAGTLVGPLHVLAVFTPQNGSPTLLVFVPSTLFGAVSANLANAAVVLEPALPSLQFSTATGETVNSSSTLPVQSPGRTKEGRP